MESVGWLIEQSEKQKITVGKIAGGIQHSGTNLKMVALIYLNIFRA